MRIARLHMDAQDKTRFEIQGKSSVKYHLKANHVVEAKRWFWALNNAIQWAKDEAKEEERRRTRESEFLHAKIQQVESRSEGGPASELAPSVTSRVNSRGGSGLVSTDSKASFSRVNTHTSRTAVEPSVHGDDETSAYGSYTQSVAHTDVVHRANGVPAGIDEEDYEDYNDYASSHDAQPTNKDAFYITAQSAKLQLDLLSNVSASLKAEKDKNPRLTVSDPVVDQALSTYESAVGSLNDLLASLSNISRDRDAYWQYRLDKESDMRKMWEESMARIVQEHEELQYKVGESEEKRRKTKKALKEVLENAPKPEPEEVEQFEAETTTTAAAVVKEEETVAVDSKKGTIYADLADSDSDSDDGAEFFDAISIEDEAIAEKWTGDVDSDTADLRSSKLAAITPAFTGYEDPVRQRLRMDQDDRPKLSLWVSLIRSRSKCRANRV
jgi:oxysterol-binding protein 1